MLANNMSEVTKMVIHEAVSEELGQKLQSKDKSNELLWRNVGDKKMA